MSDQIGNPNATFSGSGSGSGTNAASIAESVAESGPDFDALRAACETRLNASGQLAGESCTARKYITQHITIKVYAVILFDAVVKRSPVDFI